MELITKIVLITLLITTPSIASIKENLRSVVASSNKSVTAREERLAELKKRIRELEIELNSKSKNYIAGVSITEKVGRELDDIRKRLKSENDELSLFKRKVKYLLSRYAVVSNAKRNPTQVYEQKIIESSLRYFLVRLKEQSVLSNQLVERESLLKVRFEEYSSIEVMLHSMLSDLEKKKKDLTSSYLSMIKNENKAEVVLKNDSLKFKRLVPPIKNPTEMKRSDKGLTYFFKGAQKVFAPGTGRIVFTGPLASYGNVVMIDHGNDIRSVVLGYFDLKKKLGDKVSKGEIIGNASGNDNGRDDSIYLELRKKSVALNLLSWLDR